MNPFPTLSNRLLRVWTGSLRNRLLIGIGTLLAAASVIAVFGMVGRQADYLHQESREEARALAQTLAVGSVSWVLAADLAGLQEVIDAVKSYKDVRYAMVLAPDGKVLVHTDPRLQGRYARDAVSQTLLVAPLTTRFLADDSALVDVAEPIQANGAHIGWARIGLGQERIEANSRTVVREGFIYALASIALTILLVAAMTRGLTRDLGRLVRAARRIGAGEWEVKSGLQREDELGELSSAFDGMAAELDVANRELRESEEKFRQVSASAQDAIIVLDQDGRITDWNAAAENIFGYAATEVTGKDMHALLAPLAQRAAATAGLQGFRNTGTGPVINKTLELVALRRDGSEFPIELSISTVQLRGQWHAIGIVRDISERKRAEREALEQFKLAEAFFVHNVSCLAVLDRNFNFVRVNEAYARSCGREIDEFAGRNHFEMYPSDAQAIFEDVVRTKTRFTTFTRAFVYPDQPERGMTYWDWTLVPVLDAQGEVEYLVFSLNEVTERKRAEEEQRTAALYARSLIEASLDPLVTISAEGKITDVNKSTEEVTGMTRDHLVGADFADYFTEPDRARAGYQEVLARGYVRDYPLTIRHASGRTTDVLYNASVYRNEAGEFQGVFAAARDITARKQAEEALREREAFLNSVVENIPDMIFVKDAQALRFVRFNKAGEQLLGYTREELLGKNDHDFFPRKEADFFTAKDREVLAGKEAVDIPEETVRTRNEAERILHTKKIPILDNQGNPQYLLGISEDITERKQAEAVRTQLAAIVQSSNDAIIGKDLDGVITSWNPGAEKVYGYRAEEVIGKPVSILAPPDKKDEITAMIETIMHGKSVANHETERFRNDGRRIDISLDLSPIHDANGRIVGVSTIARDITEKKQAERALRKVNRALNALSRCNSTLIHVKDEMQLLQDICGVIVDIEGYRMAWVGYVEHDEKKTIRPVAQAGYLPDDLQAAGLTWADDGAGRGPLGIAIRTGQVQVVQDVNTIPRIRDWPREPAKLGYGSVLIAPLISESQVIGALTINAGEVNAFDEAEITLLTELAADTAFGITTLRLRGAHEHSTVRLQRSMEATIQAIASTVEMRDAYTAGHQRRVAELATAIARELGLTEDQIHGIHMAGVVHDLGKIHIPAEILSKPGKLSPIEFQMIKIHPEAGYEILKDVDFPWPIAQVVYQHHERLDGSGYPRGLKGNEILLEARIMMVADVVEAMASHRPYRPSLGIDVALEEIAAHTGTYYDPDAARTCIELFRNKGFKFSA